MKKLILIIMLGLLIFGCSTQKPEPEKPKDEEPKVDVPKGDETKMPVKVTVMRRWIYGVDVDNEDPKMIEALMKAIEDLEIGPETNIAYSDYTDIVVFTYDDESTLVYEFEGDQIVIDKKAYACNLELVRYYLDLIIKGEEIPE